MFRTTRTIAAAAVAAIAVGAPTAIGGSDNGHGTRGDEHPQAEKAYTFATVENGDTLVVFDKNSVERIAIDGLAAGEAVKGIDVRPATGDLYGVSTSRVFTIDAESGDVGNAKPLSVPLQGAFFGVDFNPSVDRLRIVSDTNQNYRLNVDTGANTVDTALAYPAGDRNAGKDPAVGAVGYTFAILGGATALYDVDAANDTGGANGAARPDTFTLQNPPNAGGLQSIGPVGLDITPAGGFDIAGTKRFTAFGFYDSGDGFTLYQHRFDRNGAAEPTSITLDGDFDGLAVLDAYTG